MLFARTLSASRFVKSRPFVKVTPMTIFRDYTSKRYTLNHEWISVDNDIGTVGITEHAQKALDDIVFVELPTVGKEVVQAEQVGAVESVKAACDIYAPASGEITEVNEALVNNPAIINRSAEEEGWLFSLKLTGVADLDTLLDKDAYEKYCDVEQS